MSKLLRLFRSRRRVEPEPLTAPGPATPQQEYSQHRHATADFTEADDDDEEDTNDEGRQRYARDQGADRDEDGRPADVLPMFSATTLGTTVPHFTTFTEFLNRRADLLAPGQIRSPSTA